MPNDSPATRRFSILLQSLVAAGIMVTPLVISPHAIDMFRGPKDVVFQTIALAILAVGAGGALVSDAIARTFRTDRRVVLIAAAALLWTCIVTLASLKPVVSAFKPLTVFCLAVFAIAVIWTTRERRMTVVLIALVPAAINAVVAILQSLGVWAPWHAGADTRLRTSALLGNPNEVGGFFVLPLIAAVAAAIAWRRARWFFAAIAALIAGGAVAAQSITTLAAVACGLLAVGFTPVGRRIRWAGVALLVVLALAAVIHPGSRARLQRFASAENVTELTSFRLTPYSVALQMFRDRPLVGVGPGVFGALYMPYKIRLDERHPEWIQLGNENFGEVHNDHLQILAEAGFPGYAIFLVAAVLLARLSFRRIEEPDERDTFVRAFAFPGVAAFFVLMLAHFPLQLTAASMWAVSLAAVCFGWSSHDAVS